MPNIDWFVIGIATILNLLMSAFWYSHFLFGPQWKKYNKTELRNDWKRVVLGAVSSLIIAFFFYTFESALHVTRVTDGMMIGFLFWLGFVVTTQMSSYIWANKPLQLFLIDTGYKMLSFLVIGGLMGA
jgi:hypothetical protein